MLAIAMLIAIATAITISKSISIPYAKAITNGNSNNLDVIY